jgi:hypothetical protein
MNVSNMHQNPPSTPAKPTILNSNITSIFASEKRSTALRLCVALCITTSLMACQASKTLPPPLPANVATLIDRAAQCQHFSGEINGDLSARDKEVMATMQDLQCELIATELSLAAQQYQGTPHIHHALIQASEPYMDLPN